MGNISRIIILSLTAENVSGYLLGFMQFTFRRSSIAESNILLWKTFEIKMVASSVFRLRCFELAERWLHFKASVDCSTPAIVILAWRRVILYWGPATAGEGSGGTRVCISNTCCQLPSFASASMVPTTIKFGFGVNSEIHLLWADPFSLDIQIAKETYR